MMSDDDGGNRRATRSRAACVFEAQAEHATTAAMPFHWRYGWPPKSHVWKRSSNRYRCDALARPAWAGQGPAIPGPDNYCSARLGHLAGFRTHGGMADTRTRSCRAVHIMVQFWGHADVAAAIASCLGRKHQDQPDGLASPEWLGPKILPGNIQVERLNPDREGDGQRPCEDACGDVGWNGLASSANGQGPTGVCFLFFFFPPSCYEHSYFVRPGSKTNKEPCSVRIVR
ncbi:hypothetical protein L228DRAFT_178977 [Xylona heveae TC161]|uniref:Uncharacterized protein n=1 Tax=Xylona heveae (strain CBS 132557 / TC161) TaxID=1328760 RepID=A0A165FAM2_XYLHT|nr:hypothetical protein L228DRAFT_178977 [Xylona heveae TC161]KZF20766.1 hypothetical protein L228DRAFT_178977 [Xylona heveae TC161]